MAPDVVVKIGGGMLAEAAAFARTIDAVSHAAQGARVLVVPGGGAFADAVREADQRFGLSADASHWMAVLAMDQLAWLITDKLSGGLLVDSSDAIARAFEVGRIPVLAPSRWLRAADPLPHSWDVTSDSIAAWVAGSVHAARLVLVKPPGASGEDIVDPQFGAYVPAGVAVRVVTADQISAAQLLA